MSETVFILDGHYLIYRCYHAMSQANMHDSSGQPTGAVFGLTRMVLSLLDEHEPDYLICSLDSEEPTFRHEFYEEYKIQRPEMPDRLKSQIPFIEELFHRLDVPIVREEGFESDDLIATMVNEWSQIDNLEIMIVSNDKDNFQLVDGSVRILKQKQGLTDITILDSTGVEEELGVPPGQVADYLCLVGDSADNIPGVEGIGPTYASRLLDKYQTIEEILENTEHLTETISERLSNAIIDSADQLHDSKKLTVLRTDAPLPISLSDARYDGLNRHELIDFCRSHEFRSIRESLEEELDTKPGWDELNFEFERVPLDELDLSTDFFTENTLYGITFGQDTPSKPMEVSTVTLALTDTDKTKIIELNPAVSNSDTFEELIMVLNDGEFYTHNHKFLQGISYRMGIEPPSPGVELDLELASYLIDAEQDHSLNQIISRELGTTIPDLESDWNQAKLHRWLSGRTQLLAQVVTQIEEQLNEREQDEIYETLEQPLSRILAHMEYNGIAIDTNHLQDLSQKLESKLNDLENRAHELAGESFNLNSPKQMREVLFEKLDLPVQEKTGSGKASTNADSLKKLTQYHDLPEIILQYRKYNKIESTYLSPLVEAVNPETDRIHTVFNQATASTGRLSSSNPNLQNIPVREEYGRKVRSAFIPSRDDYVLLGADYSQIELRLLAHMSRDETLMDAFNEGIDIHSKTAAELFEKDRSSIDEDDRRVAKVVNYGIAYGLSAYGLADDLEISQSTAQEYIDRYFERYPGVKAFLDQTIDEAKQKGYVETMVGRRRYIHELNSQDFYQRQFAERAAVNAPIQGTAADLIKKAMIELEPELENEPARWLLQVHDELVLEVSQSHVDRIANTVVETMEEALELCIPVTVSLKTGANWSEISK